MTEDFLYRDSVLRLRKFGGGRGGKGEGGRGGGFPEGKGGKESMWNKFKGLNKGLGGLKDIAKKIRTTEEEIEEKAALTEATGLLPKKHADFDMFKEQMLPKMATGGSLKAVRAPPSSRPRLHSRCKHL